MFVPRLKRVPNVTHQDLTKLSNLTSSHVWPTSKTWPKRDQPTPLPKFTQTNLEQARSRLNTFKISSQANTSSFH
ncbi:hypothetical protein PIB30_095303, partial [Stylosanthes scabra]|nr:hypothetical protein [Stylosanthes scabra]